MRNANVENKRVGQLRVAVFDGDAKQRPIDERWNMIDLNFTEEDYSRHLKTGVEYRCPVPTTLKLTFMMVVVYNDDADLRDGVEKELRPHLRPAPRGSPL